jgi:hypothetical protein
LTITETAQFFRVLSDDTPVIVNSFPVLTFWVVMGLTIFIVSNGSGESNNSEEFWLNNN